MSEQKRKKGTLPPHYDEAFKAGAVRMITEQGRQPYCGKPASAQISF